MVDKFGELSWFDLQTDHSVVSFLRVILVCPLMNYVVVPFGLGFLDLVF